MAKTKAKKKTTTTGKLENQRRELFCRYYAQNNQYFGNGTHAYAAAFEYNLEEETREVDADKGNEFGIRRRTGKSAYDLACNVCAVEASKLLRLPHIQERIRVLRNEWMTDVAVDGELAAVIQQNTDLGPKMQGIKEFNKLRKRVDDSPKVTIVNTDPAVQALVNKALDSFLTHDNQGNSSQ